MKHLTGACALICALNIGVVLCSAADADKKGLDGTAKQFCFVSCMPAIAARPVEALPSPPVHRFLDKPNIALQAINVALLAADISTTRRALATPGTHEANPLMQSQAAMIPLKIGAAGAALGLAYMLHRTGHHKAERLVPLFVAVPSGIAAFHNAGIH